MDQCHMMNISCEEVGWSDTAADSDVLHWNDEKKFYATLTSEPWN